MVSHYRNIPVANEREENFQLEQAEAGNFGTGELVIRHTKQLLNIYNRGLVSNWRDVWTKRSL